MSARTTRQAYWSEQNILWGSSGLGQQKFCEQQGLAYKEFVYWRGVLKKTKVSISEPKLLKISIPVTQQNSPAIAESTSCLEVILPTGIKLYIKTEADIGKASSLIQLLGGAL